MSAPKKVEILAEDMREVILAATGDIMASSCRFSDGGFSTSYKVTVMHKPDTSYVVQVRFHGNVASMDAFMKFVRATTEPGIIPMPAVYSIPDEVEHQRVTGFGRQITEFVPGVISEMVYHDMSHAERLEFVRKMALAWQACWDLPLPSPRQIGELIATDNGGSINLTVEPDRHYKLKRPFTTVRKWLRAQLRQSAKSLERAKGIDDYKKEYMNPIKKLVYSRPSKIPKAVNECPIVALHVDMGPHNVLVSEDDHAEIKAIIDWEFCSSAPFLKAYESIEMLFRSRTPEGFGPDYPQADQLRSAFWDAIPQWKAHLESQGAKDFLEWFRFALLMQPEHCSEDIPKAEKMRFWAENIDTVEGMLKKYGVQKH